MNTLLGKGYLQQQQQLKYWPQIIKRQKSSCPKQVCIVCYCSTRAYDIVVADVDSLCHKSYLAAARSSCSSIDDEFIPVRTAIRLLTPDFFMLSFCCLGSKLYAFESAPRKSAYAIDLSPFFSHSNDLNNPTVPLELRNNNYKIPVMHHPKAHPFAIPTPDSKKILLFSRLLTEGTFVGANDFELYDPKTATWQQLPGIRTDWCHSMKINVFTFIGTSTFFIETSNKQMFALNLERIDRGCQRMETFYGGARSASPRSQTGRFIVVEGHLCVSPQVAYDIHKQVDNHFGFSFPRPPLGDGIGYYKPPLVDLLGEEEAEEEGGKKYNFCTLESGISLSTNIPHMSLNVTSCDLIRYKINKDESDQDYDELDRCMTVCRPIKFRLDAQQHSPHYFFPLCFFSIDPSLNMNGDCTQKFEFRFA